MAVRSGVGFEVQGVRSAAHLFTEAPSRVVVSVPDGQVDSVRREADERGVGLLELGVAGGDRLVVDGFVDLDVSDAVEAYRSKLPRALGTGATQG
jgi:hypothetical protein